MHCGNPPSREEVNSNWWVMRQTLPRLYDWPKGLHELHVATTTLRLRRLERTPVERALGRLESWVAHPRPVTVWIQTSWCPSSRESTRKKSCNPSQPHRLFVSSSSAMPRRKPTNLKPPASASSSQKLPSCDGPKLDIFKHHQSSIEWLGRLDDVANDDNDDKHAYVFKVKIEGEEYALKIVSIHAPHALRFRSRSSQFKFFNPDENWMYCDAFVDDRNLVEQHTDPFFAECRAYGKIREVQTKNKRKGEDLAVPCLGYLFLSEKYREKLEAEYGIDLDEECMDDSDSDSDNSSPRPAKKRRARGIVKKLASNDPGITNRTVGKVRKRLKELNELQIYVRDITKENFRGGKLVDFGTAWTEPHCYNHPLNWRDAADVKVADLIQFDRITEEDEFLTNRRSTSNNFLERLRKSKGYIYCFLDDRGKLAKGKLGK